MTARVLAASVFGLTPSLRLTHFHSELVEAVKKTVPWLSRIENSADLRLGAMPVQKARHLLDCNAEVDDLIRRTTFTASNGLEVEIDSSYPDPVVTRAIAGKPYGEPKSFGQWLGLRVWLRGELELDVGWSSSCGWYFNEVVSVVGAGLLKDMELAVQSRQLRLLNKLIEKAPVVDGRFIDLDLSGPREKRVG